MTSNLCVAIHLVAQSNQPWIFHYSLTLLHTSKYAHNWPPMLCETTQKPHKGSRPIMLTEVHILSFFKIVLKPWNIRTMTRSKSRLKPPHRAVSPTACFITCLATALRLSVCHLAKCKPNTSQAASPPPQQTVTLVDGPDPLQMWSGRAALTSVMILLFLTTTNLALPLLQKPLRGQHETQSLEKYRTRTWEQPMAQIRGQ